MAVLDFLFDLGHTLSMTVTRYDELQLSSELLDRPPCPVRAKVFICSTPRTGSFLLCRAMIHHGIGIPHEYFHGRHAAIYRAATRHWRQLRHGLRLLALEPGLKFHNGPSVTLAKALQSSAGQ
jgi:hypothetical protein